jgi:hypothetical protein
MVTAKAAHAHKDNTTHMSTTMSVLGRQANSCVNVCTCTVGFSSSSSTTLGAARTGSAAGWTGSVWRRRSQTCWVA